MEENNKLPQRYIRTPFAFTRFSKNLSLLQQAVLVKVADQLQPFMEDFFNNKELHKKGRPRPLFSEVAKNSGITQFNISYAELGVSVNNFYAARKAVEDVLNLKVYAPGFKVDKNGELVKDANGKPIPALRTYNVFSYSEITANGNDRVLFNLNLEFLDPIFEDQNQEKRVVDYVFDMTQDYVSHPDNIAFIGEVEKMPMIYYLLRKKSGHDWDSKEIYLTVKEIKEYLGMLEYANNQIIKEAYPKFSQFRKNVLDTSIADINRLKRDGMLDVCVLFVPLYNGKRKVGNPAHIKFIIFKNYEDMLKAKDEMDKANGVGENPLLDFPPQSTPLESQWQSFLSHYQGELKSLLQGFTPFSLADNTLTLSVTKSLGDTYLTAYRTATPEVRDQIVQSLYAEFGKGIKIAFHYTL